MTLLRTFTRRVLWRLSLPTLVAIAIAWLAVRADAVLAEASQGSNAAAALLWLHVPGLLLTGFGLVVAIEEWPLFCRDREEAGWIRRFVIGPWNGCGLASAGTLIALAGSLAVVSIAFATLHGDQAVRAFTAVDARLGVIPPDQDRVTFPAAHEHCTGIDLRAAPVGRAGTPLATIGVTLCADGTPLHEAPIELMSASERHRIEFAPRAITELELRRADGYPRLPISMLRRPVELIGVSHSHVINALLATLSYLFPAAFALGIACALRRMISGSIATFLLIGVLIGTTVLGVTPNAAAIDACARGRWLLAEPLGNDTLLALGWSVLAFAVAAFTGKRRG